jgi:hypothetical protein
MSKFYAYDEGERLQEKCRGDGNTSQRNNAELINLKYSNEMTKKQFDGVW